MNDPEYKEMPNSNSISIPAQWLACRVCLSTEFKLYNLHTNGLAEIYTDLTEMPVMIGDNLPQHVCTFCRYLMQKNASFKALCQKTCFMLEDLVSRGISSVKEDNISKSFNFNHKYSISKFKSIEILPFDVNLYPIDDLKPDIIVKSDSDQISDNYLNVINDFNYNVNIHKYDIDAEFEKGSILDAIDNNITVQTSNVNEASKEEGAHKEIYTLTHVNIKTKCKKSQHNTKVKNDTVVKCDKPKISTLKNKSRENNKKEKFERKKSGIANVKEDYIEKLSKYNVEVVTLSKDEQIKEIEERQAKYKNYNFKCEFCYKAFMREVAYKNHLELHDPSSGDYACDICHIRFTTKTRCYHHSYKHRMTLKCKQCHFTCKEPGQAKQHYDWHLGLTYKCKHCGKIFNRHNFYMLHIRTQHGSSICTLCHQTFIGEKGLNTHMSLQHRKAVQYRCVSCSVQFENETALRRHLVTNCQDCSRPCTKCGENFTEQKSLIDHLQSLHDVKLNCEECEIKFEDELQYNRHRNTIHRKVSSRGKRVRGRPRGPTVYMCEVCGRKCQNPTSLRDHQRVHTGEKPHQCSECPKTFRSQIQLQYHMNSHSGETPYKCPHCPKAFAKPCNRSRHLRVHTKEKPHVCAICEKTFQQSNNLKMHIRTAHLKEPWPKRNRR